MAGPSDGRTACWTQPHLDLFFSPRTFFREPEHLNRSEANRGRTISHQTHMPRDFVFGVRQPGGPAGFPSSVLHFSPSTSAILRHSTSAPCILNRLCFRGTRAIPFRAANRYPGVIHQSYRPDIHVARWGPPGRGSSLESYEDDCCAVVTTHRRKPSPPLHVAPDELQRGTPIPIRFRG